MGSRSVRPKVRRRKVANLAAYSRQHSVRNCTIKTAENIPAHADWPEQKYPQYKSMMKKHIELV